MSDSQMRPPRTDTVWIEMASLRKSVTQRRDIDKPYAFARITRTGRLLHHVVILDGIGSHGGDYGSGWVVLGRRWAEWKARRELRRYLDRKNPEAWEVRIDG